MTNGEKLVRRFEKSVRKEEMSGSLRPSEMVDAAVRFKADKKALLEYILELENKQNG